MLKQWGLDASEHRPRQWERALCDQAEALFVMAPAPLRRLVSAFGTDLAGKTSLFADPFSRPWSLPWGADKVCDPSFDERPVEELIQEFVWMRERVHQIRLALGAKAGGLFPHPRIFRGFGRSIPMTWKSGRPRIAPLPAPQSPASGVCDFGDAAD
jgi:hypothetical protein